MTWCRVLKVSQSGYDAWLDRDDAPKPEAVRFDVAVRVAFAESHGRYGSRRVQTEFNGEGIACRCSRVAAAIRRNKLRARRWIVLRDGRVVRDVEAGKAP